MKVTGHAVGGTAVGGTAIVVLLRHYELACPRHCYQQINCKGV